jgi:serine/threonine protein phosphatase PrpC
VTVFRASAATDVGRRARNEDAAFVGDRLVVVADGLGGHRAGDVASALVVARFAQLDAGLVSAESIAQTVLAANDDLLRHAVEHPDAAGLGTTVAGVGAVTVAGVAHWAVFNVGDSRVYRFWAGVLSRAPVDHSAAEEMLLNGSGSGGGSTGDEDVRARADRGVVTRSLGTDPAPQLDLWLLPALQPERFLVCSDGLTSVVDDVRIADLMARHPEPGEACRALVAEALGAGGTDNVTVVVLDARAVPVAPGLDRTVPRDDLAGRER